MDLKDFVTSLESMLNRFEASGSVWIGGYAVPKVRKDSFGQRSVEFEIPGSAQAQTIRKTWRADRRELPRTGIVFTDGSVLTIRIKASELPVPKQLRSVEQYLVLREPSGKAFGYIAQYCYCFYPNSELAEEIGYLRYDFHSDAMGEGDLGEHTYFHMHHRKVDKAFRLPTGPILDFDKIISGIEKVLAPELRAERLNKSFLNGAYETLLFDLTIDGINNLAQRLVTDWKTFKHADTYYRFLNEYLDTPPESRT